MNQVSGLINKAAKEMEDEYKLTKNIYEKIIAQNSFKMTNKRKILKDIPIVQTNFELMEFEDKELTGDYKRERTSTLNYGKHPRQEIKKSHERVFSQDAQAADYDIIENQEYSLQFSASPNIKHANNSYSNDSGSESSSYFSVGFDCKLKQDGIYIESCLQNNCFDKITNFQDQLGRRMVVGIDWELMKYVIDFNLEEQETEDDKRCTINTSHRYIKQQFYEKLIAMNIDPSNEENSKETFDFIVKSISESKILKRLLMERYSLEDECTDNEQTFYSSDESPNYNGLDKDEAKQANFEIVEKKRRINLISQIIDQDFSFEVELVNQYGAYWGTLTILTAFSENINENLNQSTESYLYFSSKNKILDETRHCYEAKYNFRSFQENQKKGSIEILINISKIKEIMCKMYLLNPVAIELYDEESNQMYFFNFMNPENRDKFVKVPYLYILNINKTNRSSYIFEYYYFC